MSMYKGITGTPGLLFFALIVGIIISVLFIISAIPVAQNILSIRSETRFEVEQDSIGSGLAAFLASDSSSGNTRCSELLGQRAAEGFDSSLDGNIDEKLSKMSPPGRIAVYYNGILVKDYNGVSSSHVSADIAIPGLKKGEVRAS